MKKLLIEYIREESQCNYEDIDDYFKDIAQCNDKLKAKYLLDLIIHIAYQEQVEEIKYGSSN